jgi:hypothetical protein
MSIEQESGNSVLIDMHGIPGMGSISIPPATVADVGRGEQENPVSKPNGDEADMLDEVGEADPEKEIADWDCSSSRIPSRIESRVMELSGIMLLEWLWLKF